MSPPPRIALLLAAVLAGCGETEDAPKPQARTIHDGEETRAAVQVPGEWETPFEDPAPLDELVASVEGFAALRPAEQQNLAQILNAVPSACLPCDRKPLARCAVAPPKGCENVPPLVGRAVRMVTARVPPEVVRRAVSYPDVWLPIPHDRTPALDPNGAVRVEVWLDFTSPFTAPTLQTIGKLPDKDVGLVVRFLPDAEQPSSKALAAGAIAAERQGKLFAFAEAAEAWRAGARDALRDGGGPFADGGVEAVGAQLVAQGLDLDRWEQDRASADAAARIADDRELAGVLGVRAVPTWFVDGYRLRGSQSDLALGRVVGLALEDLRATRSE